MIVRPGDVDAVLAAEPDGFDLAIIGAGPVGLAIAHRLLNRDLRIVILEAGGARLELGAQNDAFAGSVEPAFHPPLTLYRRRMLGGASTIWGGRCIPYDNTDFDATGLGDGASWPIARSGVASYMGEATVWLEAGLPQFTAAEALPGAPASLIEGTDDPRLSLSDVERFSPPLNAWHRYGWEIAAIPSVIIVPHIVCTGIIADPAAPRAEALRLRKCDGTSLTLKARWIVIAGGGIETTRLLLASREGRPQGLGNGHDLLGRFYMTHILADVGRLKVLDPERVHLDYAFSRDGVYVRRLLKLSEAARRERGLLNAVARAHIPPAGDAAHGDPILSAAYLTKRLVLPEYRRRLVGEDQQASSLISHIGNVILGMPRLPATTLYWLRRRVFARRKLPSLFLNRGRDFPLEVVAEQAPHRDSRIVLGDETDRNGMPRINIRWHIGRDDTESLATTLSLMREALAPSRSAHLEISDDTLKNLGAYCRPQPSHHIGTARMGENEHDSVTDQWGALWEARNVYVAGAALFPRSGIANPTLMGVALALRTADRIYKEFSHR